MKLKFESGRSMVEMLGVLAIVGVLSVGGVAGYSYAMDKHKANNLLNELNVRAVIISQQLLRNDTVDLSEFTEDTTHPITVEEFGPDSSNYFALQISGVGKGTCEQLLKNHSQSIIGIYQDNVRISNDTDCQDETTLTFVYANNLSPSDDFSTNDDYDCMETCPTGSVNPTCSSGEKAKTVDGTACGQSCAVCLNDTCPGDTSKSCGSGYRAYYAGKTEYGTSCYTCSVSGIVIGHPGGTND